MDYYEWQKKNVTSAGGLHNLGAHLNWYPGETSVCLDGNFDLQELAYILEYIRAYNKYMYREKMD